MVDRKQELIKWLRMYFQLQKAVNEAEELAAAIESAPIGAIQYAHDNISSNRISDLTSKIAIKAIDIKESVDKARVILRKVDRALDVLDENERQIVILRYIEGHWWTRVAMKTHYSRQWCQEKADRALEKLCIAVFGPEVSEQ